MSGTRASLRTASGGIVAARHSPGKAPLMPQGQLRHFGVLIPSTNTTAEIEYSRLLPEGWQAHYARMATSSVNKTPFSPPRDEDLDYQAKLLGTARVEAVFLLQTSASLFADGYCADVSRRISAAAGVPGFTSAMAIGEAAQALGTRRDRPPWTKSNGLSLGAVDANRQYARSQDPSFAPGRTRRQWRTVHYRQGRQTAGQGRAPGCGGR